MKFVAAFALVLILSSSSLAVERTKEGCWSPQDWCIQTDTRRGSTSFRSFYKNICDAGIVLKVCHQLRSGHPHSCGQIHLSPGETEDFRSMSDNSTGRYAYSGTGSNDWRNDWVCLDMADSSDPRDRF